MNYAEKDQILRDFVKLIDFYNSKSVLQNGDFLDDMDGLLTLFLLELIQAGKCVSKRYVAVALRNEYIRISKKFLAIKKGRKEFFDFCATDDFVTCTDEKMLVADMLKALTNEQKNIVKLRFWDGLTCDEIARRKGITKQAVCQTQKRAIDKIKTLL